MTTWISCHCCGQVHRLTAAPHADDLRAVCCRCGTQLAPRRSPALAAQRTAAAALGALILYIPAMGLPILEIERLGHRHESSLLSGTWTLLTEGELFVGMVILVFSILLPLLKILLLLELSWVQVFHQRHRAWTYRLTEWTGRWSMLDVLLLALLVMLIKVNDLVTFHLGPAVGAFVGCVVLSLLASSHFDPEGIWDRVSAESEPEASGRIEPSATSIPDSAS